MGSTGAQFFQDTKIELVNDNFSVCTKIKLYRKANFRIQKRLFAIFSVSNKPSLCSYIRISFYN